MSMWLPRVCGEHLPYTDADGDGADSPPRVRGARGGALRAFGRGLRDAELALLEADRHLGRWWHQIEQADEVLGGMAVRRGVGSVVLEAPDGIV